MQINNVKNNQSFKARYAVIGKPERLLDIVKMFEGAPLTPKENVFGFVSNRFPNGDGILIIATGGHDTKKLDKIMPSCLFDFSYIERMKQQGKDSLDNFLKEYSPIAEFLQKAQHFNANKLWYEIQEGFRSPSDFSLIA